jgi:hypothetical protein
MGDGQIQFTRFKLERVEELLDKKDERYRVFCGPALESHKLSKGDAAGDEQFSVFFDKNGNFKRWSVVRRGRKTKR